MKRGRPHKVMTARVQRCQRAGLTQRDIAVSIGMSRATVARWQVGDDRNAAAVEAVLAPRESADMFGHGE